MDFITRAYLKHEIQNDLGFVRQLDVTAQRRATPDQVNYMSISHRIVIALIVGFMSAAATSVFAGSVTVNSAESDVVNDMVVVNADLNFEFSDDAKEAVRSGIALFVDVDIRVKRKRRFMWDPRVLALSRRYSVERHALTDRYIITDLVTTDRRIYDSLDAAIRDLGNIRGIPIAETSSFTADFEYNIGLRSRLDLESLPAPLRPIAYISPSWRMSSGWYQWILSR
ncbi:MAG: DUF4390 domain-containing protein [Gammaproteobacteria bacterium]